MPPSPAAPGSLVGSSLGDLASAIAGAKQSVALATPFLSSRVAWHLVRAADEGGASKRRFLTALNVAAVEGGYLDPNGVEAFVAAGFDVRSLRNLHAKAAVVDDRWELVGSGNLTVAGSNGGNSELGVVLTPPQARAARADFFDPWWEAAEPLDMSYLRSLRTRKRPRSPERRQRQGQGGFFKAPLGIDLDSETLDAKSSGYWLKIMYGTPERIAASYWRRLAWISDRHTMREGQPIRRPTYQVGDHLVVYLSRGHRRACPAILRVKKLPVFDPERVRRETNAHDAEKWAWVTEVQVVAVADLDRAPTLSDIGVPSASVRQHGHIHLSPERYRRALTAIKT